MDVAVSGVPKSFADVPAGELFAFDAGGTAFGFKMTYRSGNEAVLVLHGTGRSGPNLLLANRNQLPRAVYSLLGAKIVTGALPDSLRESIRNPVPGTVVVTATDKLICFVDYDNDPAFASLTTGQHVGYDVREPAAVFDRWDIAAVVRDEMEVVAEHKPEAGAADAA